MIFKNIAQRKKNGYPYPIRISGYSPNSSRSKSEVQVLFIFVPNIKVSKSVSKNGYLYYPYLIPDEYTQPVFTPSSKSVSENGYLYYSYLILIFILNRKVSESV